MTIVTRFPPSPTGFLHIGNARTALFNWCYARHVGGKFLLRIEDTDKERSTQPAIDAIFEAMKWMGLDWDNDEVVFQSQRADRHVEVAKEMIARGQAYYCYCSPEELQAMRDAATAKGEQPRYNGMWRDRDPSLAPQGVNPVIRIKAPQDGVGVINDKVQGEVKVDNKQLDDFILVRSDGSPTYMLAVVVDDHDMGVTHVMRGDDHLNNAFRQRAIYDNMGWELPTYAHLPLLHGEDGAKFSKRHGALGVMDYAKLGYVPEALNNQLLRMGWSHGDDEIISMKQAVEWFNLESINRAPARFDVKKLSFLNAHYIKTMDDDALLALLLDFHDAHGLPKAKKDALLAGLPDLKERATTLVDLWADAQIYIQDLPLQYEDKAMANLTPENAPTLKTLIDKFGALDAFMPAQIEDTLKSVANDMHEGKFGKVGMPLRAALTGRANSPALHNVAAAIGREETIRRIEAAIQIAQK